MPEIPLSLRKAIKGNWLWLSLLAIVVTGCLSGPPDKKTGKDRPETEKSGSKDTIRLNQLKVSSSAAYSIILDDLDRNDLQNIGHALTIFCNNQADSLSRDSMLVAFNEFMTSAIQEYYDRKLIVNKELADQFKNKENQNEAQNMITFLSSNGINLFFRDGDFYLEPDISFIYNHLKQVLTAGSRDYLQTKINLANSIQLPNVVPLSQPDSLAFRVTAWEDFMTKYPDYLLKDEIQTLYLDALSVYLSGNEQLPLFDSDTRKLQKGYQVSYLRFIKEHPNRASAGIVKKFYDLMESNGFKYSEEQEVFRSEVNGSPIQNPQ